jgi:uncharacterized protein (DUF433 family)
MATLLGNGLYSFKEAARLTGLKHARVREWFRGKPVFTSDIAPVDGDFAISFYDLVDVYVAGQLREHGVPLQTVRKVYNRLRADLATDHPFCRRDLLTDGRRLLLHGVDKDGEEELTEILSNQGAFVSVIMPFLKTIDYDTVTLLARRWRIADSIVVDPEICFGTPVVESARIPTAILATALAANNQDALAVARWYGVKPEDVRAAAAFESGLAA